MLTDCFIQVNFTGDTVQVYYEPPDGVPAPSRAINIPKWFYEDARKEPDYVQLTPEMAKRSFVFVTGSSANHFTELLRCFETVQKHFPERKILFYDLGLNTKQKLQVLQ